MKIGMLSLGCPKNLVDSEVMLGLAQQAGHELTRDAANADVLVVNQCAFIDSAKQESIDAILEMAELKERRSGETPDRDRLLAERYRDKLMAEDPGDRRGARTGEVPDIVRAIAAAALRPDGASPFDILYWRRGPTPGELTLMHSPRLHRASARHGRRRRLMPPTWLHRASARAWPQAPADATYLASRGLGSAWPQALQRSPGTITRHPARHPAPSTAPARGPATSTTPTRHACWRRRGTMRT